MNLPLILVCLDDASVGVFNQKETLVSVIEVPDINTYKVFDENVVGLEFKVIRKQFLGLFLGHHIDIVDSGVLGKRDLKDLFEYIVRKLNYYNINIQTDMMNNLSYLLNLLINIKGYNKWV